MLIRVIRFAVRLCVFCALCGGTVRAEQPPDAAFAFDPPAPIVQPLRVEATGGVTTEIFIRADGDVASVNVRNVTRHCYQIHLVDASGQEATFRDRRACGLTVWVPLAAQRTR